MGQIHKKKLRYESGSNPDKKTLTGVRGRDPASYKDKTLTFSVLLHLRVQLRSRDLTEMIQS